MKIIKSIIICSVLCLIGCQENTDENRLIPIKVSKDKSEHFDTIYGRDISKSDSVMFLYDNDNFKESIDTLIFLKNRTQMMGKTLEFVRKKVFVFNGINNEIEKYYYDGDGFHSFNIFYVNREKGIIINTTHSDWIIEYDYLKNKTLIEEIKKDTLFFGYE